MWLALCLPVPSRGQDHRESGVDFDRSSSLDQIRAKARTSKKFVFVNLVSTRCPSCVAMDREIFRLPSVGAFVNQNFISVKLQIDSAANDDSETQRRYADARLVRAEYRVNKYPTFLFFTPDGRIVHRGEGAKTADAFLELAADALDPAKQYYTLLHRYKDGKAPLRALPALARSAYSVGDTVVAKKAAAEYIDRLRAESLYSKENLEFIRAFTRSSRDRGFALFHREAATVDSILGSPGASQMVVSSIITHQEIKPALAAAVRDGSVPRWTELSKTVDQKYGEEYVARTVLPAKVQWFRSQKDWDNYIDNLVLYMERNLPKEGAVGSGVAMGPNNAAWDVFVYSSDKTILNKALAWSDRAIKAAPESANIDTYANLLYKLGRTEEAIQWEQVAVKLDPANKQWTNVLERMRRGEPTWLQQ